HTSHLVGGKHSKAISMTVPQGSAQPRDENQRDKEEEASDSTRIAAQGCRQHRCEGNSHHPCARWLWTPLCITRRGYRRYRKRRNSRRCRQKGRRRQGSCRAC